MRQRLGASCFGSPRFVERGENMREQKVRAGEIGVERYCFFEARNGTHPIGAVEESHPLREPAQRRQ